MSSIRRLALDGSGQRFYPAVQFIGPFDGQSRALRRLAALYFGHAGAHTETPSMTIVLRKVRGLKGLTPLFRSKGGSFGSGIGPSAVGNFLFSPLVLVAIAIAFGIAWIAAHGGWHPTGATGLAAFALFPIGRTAVEEADAKLAEKSKHMHEVFEAPESLRTGSWSTRPRARSRCWTSSRRSTTDMAS
jgi:hypothetical protein